MSSSITTLATLAVLAGLVSAKDGRTFAVNHFYGQGPLTTGRMDPIVNPGVASGHVHTIQGGSNFALTMSDTTLLDSNCTSALVKNDFSNYWTPGVYFHDPNNGSFISVPMFYMNVYYFFEETDDEIVEFQPGHRMVIGNPNLRTPPATGANQLDPNNGPIQPVQFTCPRTSYNPPSYPPNSDGMSSGLQDPGNQGAGAGFPDYNCDGYASPLRADIHFPSCYNPAVSIDDYKNNMAFPTSKGASAGKQNCPPGWHHLPHLFYEVYWNTPLFVDLWEQGPGKNPFCLSNGDPTGYSLHADFIAGWVPGTLQQVIDNCNTGDGGMDTCPGLIGGVNNAGTSCNIPSAIDEQVFGVLDKLPGDNPIVGFGGTVASSGSSSGSAPSAAVSSAPASSSVAAASAAASSAASVVATASSTPASSNSSPASGSETDAAAPASSSPPSSQPSKSDSDSSDTSGTQQQGQPSASEQPSTPTPSTPANTSPACSAPQQPSTSDSQDPSSNTTLPASIADHTYLGCYSDLLSPRQLTGIQFADIGIGQVTTTKCVEYCDAHGFALAGTEYAGQCFCGDELGSESTELEGGECDMRCEGDKAEVCGGSLALSVWKNTSGGEKRRVRREEREEVMGMEKERRRHARHLAKHLS